METCSSLPCLLYQRSTGMRRSIAFRNDIAFQKSSHFVLLDNPRVASPHRGAIPALQVDHVEGRFLLSGSADATVCIFDLSKWGTDHYPLKRSSPEHAVYKPVAQSVRVPFDGDAVLQTPHGHSHSVVAVQWYPIDTGAFLSASAEGSLLVWDTHVMEPVIRWNPLPSISCVQLSESSLLAVGSVNDSFVRLLDIRSGASSHSLVGHEEGVTCLEWSPTSNVIVASGSLDGTIRLWDVRKSGSRSCLTVLDRDQTRDDAQHCRPCCSSSSYSHLAKNIKLKASPNNYRHSESSGIVSHGGAISALSFTADGSSLVSTGTDGKLQAWDLLGNGHVLPINFSSRPNQPAVSRNRTRIPMTLQDCGNHTMAWVGHGSQVLGYSLEKGGCPTHVLEGHMHEVTSLERVDHSMQLFSAAMDGMILAWGSPPPEALKRRKRSTSGTVEQSKRIREQRDRDSWSLTM